MRQIQEQEAIRAATHKVRLVNSGERMKDPDVEKLLVEFNDVFSSDLSGGRKMKGVATIHLKNKNRRPRQCTTARRPPKAYEKASEKHIDKMESDDLIAEVKIPTQYVSPAHFVVKPDGSLRAVVDFSGEDG